MLRSMRKSAKSLPMKLFLIFLAAGFALWGIGDISSGLFSANDNAIEANGKIVTAQEAAVEFERTRRTLGADLSVGEAVAAGVLNEVLGALARQTLFEAEAEIMGVTTTQNMHKTLLKTTPQFLNETGEFSENLFRQFLYNANLNEEAFLKRVASALIQQQIEGVIIGAGNAQPALTQLLSQYQLEKRDARLRSFAIADENVGRASEAALGAFYEQVKEEYEAPALRSFDVVLIAPEIIEQQITISEEEIREVFEVRRDEFITPEKREVKQMVFETEEAARAALADIRAGTGFAEVAQARLGWEEADVNLGMVTQNDLADALSLAVFEAEIGEILGPLSSVFGWHLMQVEQVEEAANLGLDAVRDNIETTLKTEKALDRLYAHITLVEDRLGAGATLAEAVLDTGLKIGRIEAIDREGRTIEGEILKDSFGDLASDSQFLFEAWETPVGEMSPIVETAQNSFFVVETVQESPPRARELNEVKDRLHADWSRRQKINAARMRAETARGQKSDFAQIPKTEPFSRTGAGLDHEAAHLIAEAAFEQKKGEIALIETESHIILVQTQDIMPALQTELEARQQLIQTELDQIIQRDLGSALAITLSEKHELEMNVRAVQNILTGQTAP